jgi:hypothetical protein
VGLGYLSWVLLGVGSGLPAVGSEKRLGVGVEREGMG